jgi:5'-deoxynucleotidase YfbR-like HD superfamily hydrolase
MKNIVSEPISAQNTLDVVAHLLIPSATVFRTTKVQPELDRFENDAEHSFLLATLGCAIAQQMNARLDLGKVSQYALVHDLVEAYAGDTTIWASTEEHASKAEREEEALQLIEERFGKRFPWIDQTIKKYERFDEPESCFVYALDKIIPYIVMAAVDHQPFPPHKALYEEKMEVARKKIARYPELLGLFEDLDTDYKKRPHFFKAQ